jgi:serine/threonine-protein kinase
VWLALIAFTSALPAAAQSDPPAPEAEKPVDDVEAKSALARSAFVSGAKLSSQSRWEEALAEFERSAALRAHAGTTYNIAYCLRALGRYTRARKTFLRALEQNRAAGGNELGESLVADSMTYLKEIEARVSRVRLSILPQNATVTVDGRPLELIDAGTQPPTLSAGTAETTEAGVVPGGEAVLLVDPGDHIFVVSHPSYHAKAVTRTFAPAVTTPMKFKLTGLVEGERQGDTEALHRRPVARRLERGPLSAVGLVVGGVGVGVLAVGSYYGVRAITKQNASEDHCPTRATCDAEGVDLADDAKRSATIANFGIGIGLGAVAAGGLLFWLDGKREAPAPLRSLQVGARGISVGGSF